MPVSETSWHIIHAKPGWEKKVISHLSKKNIENYSLSALANKRRDHGRNTVYDLPITSYIFVRLPEAAKPEVRKIAGVINFVYWLASPVIVTTEEIEIIKKISVENRAFRLEKAKPIPLDQKRNNSSSLTNITMLPSIGYIMYIEATKFTPRKLNTGIKEHK